MNERRFVGPPPLMRVCEPVRRRLLRCRATPSASARARARCTLPLRARGAWACCAAAASRGCTRLGICADGAATLTSVHSRDDHAALRDESSLSLGGACACCTCRCVSAATAVCPERGRPSRRAELGLRRTVLGPVLKIVMRRSAFVVLLSCCSEASGFSTAAASRSLRSRFEARSASFAALRSCARTMRSTFSRSFMSVASSFSRARTCFFVSGARGASAGAGDRAGSAGAGARSVRRGELGGLEGPAKLSAVR